MSVVTLLMAAVAADYLYLVLQPGHSGYSGYTVTPRALMVLGGGWAGAIIHTQYTAQCSYTTQLDILPIC